MKNRRKKVFVNKLTNPRGVIQLMWPGGDKPDSWNVRPHRCTPGLAVSVQKYVLSIEDEKSRGRCKASKRLRHPAFHIDPGGMVLADSKIVCVGIDAGGRPFYISCFSDHLHAVVGMLERAEEKVYTGVKTVRLMSFPDIVCVLRPEERDQAVSLLRPLKDKSLQEYTAGRQQLAAQNNPHLLLKGPIPPLPVAGEA